MTHKTVYMIPVVGIFATLFRYEEDNQMGDLWMYYQAVCLMGFIALMTYIMV